MTSNTNIDMLVSARAKVTAMRAGLKAQILDQPTAVDLLVSAVLLAEHIAIVGPQGEGKTYLAERLSAWLPGSRFYALLTKFSVPDEVLGHYSLAKLQNDIYERRTTDKAPESELVVLDEVFKANSPMLNSLLGLMNERVVDGIPCKLRTLVGLSNEWPRGIESLDRSGDDESLLPLWDRFVFRLEIQRPTSDATFESILRGTHAGGKYFPLTVDELDAIGDLIDKVHHEMTPAIVESLLEIRAHLSVEGITPSSRRWHKAGRALAAYAVAVGDDSIRGAHLQILRHVLWDRPNDRSTVSDIVLKHGSPETAIALELELHIAEAIQAARGSSSQDKLDLANTITKAGIQLKNLIDAPATRDRDEISRVLAWMRDELSKLKTELARGISI